MIRRFVVATLGIAFCVCTLDVHADDFDNCSHCHRDAAKAFSRSAMSRAARTQGFQQEWQDSGQDQACLGCHAPSAGPGLQCRDCHGAAKHPVEKLDLPNVCARCHNAPGENTVDAYLTSRAFQDGRMCTDCHAGRGEENVHVFKGPSTEGFLSGVARLRAGLMIEHGRVNALMQISHRAGHSLPGGTTGRAVWFVAEGLNAEGQSVWSQRVRFGWVHDGQGNWRDETLRPDRQTQIAIEDIGRAGAVRLRATLFYQFAAGDFEAVPNAARYTLDQVELAIPGEGGAARY